MSKKKWLIPVRAGAASLVLAGTTWATFGLPSAYAAMPTMRTTSVTRSATSQQTMLDTQQPNLPNSSRSQRTHITGMIRILPQVAQFLGLTSDDLMSNLRAGQSLARVAQSQGVTAEALSGKMQAILLEMIQLSVKNDLLTQAQAAAQITLMRKNLPMLIAKQELFRNSEQTTTTATPTGLLQDAAAALRLTPQALLSSLRTGHSLDQVAVMQDVDPAQLAQTLELKISERIQQLTPNMLPHPLITTM